MRSIRVKIAAITIVAILTSILSVIGTCFFTVELNNDRSSAEMMNLLSRTTQQSLDDYLDSIEQSVEMVANIAVDSLSSMALVEGGVAGSAAKTGGQTPEQAKKLNTYLHAHVSKTQDAFSSVASHTNGVVTYYYCIASEISQTEHGFFYSRVGKTGFERQTPLDARTLDPEDMEHTTWYYTPIQRGRPSWVGPYRAHFLGEVWTVSYLVPIYKAGTLVGVLGMDVLYDTLIAQVSPIRLYETGFACLLDENGTVIYHPQMELGSTPDIETLGLPKEIFKQNSSGEELIRYTASNGEERQLAFSTLSNGVKLLVVAPVREINAPWIRLTRVILLTAALIIAFFAVLVMFSMGLITRPLKRLTAASQRLANGDYDVELDYEKPDEVGTLTKAFNQMRDHIRQNISDLNRRVITDDLTGLPNMGYFFTLTEEGEARLMQEGKRPTLLYFNLIGMKYFNRQRGFAEGNKLLCAFAELLRSRFDEERCCRFSRDHFAVLTDDENLEARIRSFFDDCRQINGAQSLPVRVGVYQARQDAVDVSVACDRAKFACDRLRGSSVSDFCVFDDSMLAYIENYRYVIGNLDRALEEQWIRVYYQPIVRAANGRVCDEEALSRWIDPVKGYMSPADFIPILEEARLIYKLDLYVLDQILLKIKEQKRQGLYVVPQSLNVSRADFDMCDMVEEICRRVDAAGVPREKLTIEVTESAVGKNFDFVKQQVQRLQEQGFKVWMDDFGSGYSALDVLQNIRFDVIKLDMRFMQRFDEGSESKIILTEMVKMAVSLGIDTVAEGVETKEQADFLREIGCTKLQGYYFCQAVPLEDILERYRRGIQIGFENPDETGYYTAIGKINLYDLTAVSGSGEGLGNFFDSMPMAVVESNGKKMQIVRCNKSYRDFMERNFASIELARKVDFTTLEEGPGAPFAEALSRSREAGGNMFIDEKLPNGRVIHAMARHIAVNPVTSIIASVVVVLGVTEE